MQMSKEQLAELATWWNGAHKDHDHCSTQNLVNLALFLIGGVPTIIWGAIVIG